MSKKRKKSRAGRAGKKARGRVGDARRRAILTAAALTIPAGLVISVTRSAEGTRLAEQLEELRRETRLLEEALVDEVVRVDSLASRERIGHAAGALGLRQAEDFEVVILRDVGRSTTADGEGS